MKLFLSVYVVIVILVGSNFFQEADLEESMERGSEIYADFCVTCHLENGEGVANTFPPLAQSDYLANNREASIRGVKFGQQGEIVVNGVTYNNIMAPMGLEDDEIADVMNFVMNSWGNTSNMLVTPDEVKAIEK
jgi:mono/diheme cytochrome c family protein